ncbi:uncharacterized protein TNCV_3116941 [Trichonephila clavipes]|nr:uncharacterized protein TNCV_3116941 [Trichonephila clavipes]
MARLVMSSCLVLLKNRRVEGLMHVKSVEVQNPPRRGVEIREPIQVLSSSLDHGSKLRSPSHVVSGKREKKADLIKLATELGECKSHGEELKIIELRAKILTNDAYKEDPEFVKCIFEGIVSNRIDEENKQKVQTLREFELQKKCLQNETQRVEGPQN